MCKAASLWQLSLDASDAGGPRLLHEVQEVELWVAKVFQAVTRY